MGGLGIPIIDEKHRIRVRDNPVTEDWVEIALDETAYAVVAKICGAMGKGIPRDTAGNRADFSGFPKMEHLNVFELEFEKGTRWNVVDGWVK